MNLGKPDPKGYYILVFNKDVLSKLGYVNGIIIEKYSDTVIVKVKSRSLAKRLIKRHRNYLINFND